ncbi:MAG: hypothetical protein OXE46_12595 [Chloroflexi bacterium]|nr:hypothetical protein [Chloroflexota bacterium]
MVLLCLCASVLVGCEHTEESTPTPTPIQHYQVTYLASRLHPGFELALPLDWQYRVTESGLILANDPIALEAAGNSSTMPDGALAADLSLLTPAEVIAFGARNAAGLLDAFVGRLSDVAGESQYRAVEMLEIDGRDSAQLSARIAVNDTLLLALALDDHYLLAVIVATTGKMQALAADLSEIFASAQLLQAE